MLSNKPLGELPPLLQVILLICLCLLSGGLFAIMAMNTVPGYSLFEIQEMLSQGLATEEMVPEFWYLQGLTALGTFVFPGIVFSYYWSYEESFLPLGLKHNPSAKTYLFILLLMLLSVPLVYAVYHWNQEIKLPAAWQELEASLRASEEKASQTINMLLGRTSLSAFLINMLVMAVLPAIGEELIFRGLLQRSFQKAFQNHHLAIWMAAILFSAIHMQWLGFFPRMLLGALFGYLVFWTGSLLPAIFGHLLNNSMALMAEYGDRRGWIQLNEESLRNLPSYLVMLSLFLSTLLLYKLYTSRQKTAAFERLD
ncbi:MAG: lysostaphin resistance A-like protein [Bacteroidia bacterium]